MLTIKHIFIACFAVNLLLLVLNVTVMPANKHQLTEAVAKSNKYQFADPGLAYQILTKLDVGDVQGFEKSPIERELVNFQEKSRFYDLKSDINYCDRHRAEFVQNPMAAFTEGNYLSSHTKGHIIRKEALDVMGKYVMPQIKLTYSAGEIGDPKFKKGINDHRQLPTNVNLLVFLRELYFDWHIGKQYSCLAQMSNHIPGIQTVYRKDKVATALYEYSKNYETRPHCLNNNKFFPQNYLMFDKAQCQAFFAYLKTDDYRKAKQERNIVFMRKIGAEAHNAMGVFPMDTKEEAQIKKTYNDGKKCGIVKANTIMQAFIHNPLLLDGYRFDFRAYLLIASTNPVMAFFHNGFLRVSIYKYNLKSGDKRSLISNLDGHSGPLAEAWEKGSYQGKSAEDIFEEYIWTFEKFEKHMYDSGKITDPNWTQNYLIPEFRKMFAHLVRMSQGSFTKSSTLYQLLGVDIMLDENLNLWFIEANIRPAYIGRTPGHSEFMKKLNQDQFELLWNLLRSRLKRVHNYVNNMILNQEASRNFMGSLEIKDFDKKLEEFKLVNRNFFEPEFEISPDNGFLRVVDENYKGVERYAGLISEDCL